MTENKKNESSSKTTPGPSLFHRLRSALAPVAAGLFLDTIDLATVGPLGFLGFFVGTGIGWWMSGAYGISSRARFVWALLAGVYCLTPFTEMLPLATILSAVARIQPGNEVEHKDKD
jgi:hypothetical protein